MLYILIAVIAQITFYSHAALSSQSINIDNLFQHATSSSQSPNVARFFQDAALQLHNASTVLTTPPTSVLFDEFDFLSAARIVEELPHDPARALHTLELASTSPEKASELIQEVQYIESLQTVSPQDPASIRSMAMRALQNIACGFWYRDPMQALNFIDKATTMNFLSHGADKHNHHHLIDPTIMSMIFIAYTMHATHERVRDMFHPDDVRSILEFELEFRQKYAHRLYEKQMAPACPIEQAAKGWLINFNKYKIAPTTQLHIDQALAEPVMKTFDAVGLNYLIPTFLQHQPQGSLIALIHEGNLHAHAFATSMLHVIENHSGAKDKLIHAAIQAGNPIAHFIQALIIIRDKKESYYEQLPHLLTVAKTDPSIKHEAQWYLMQTYLDLLDHPEKGLIDPFIQKLENFSDATKKDGSPWYHLAQSLIAEQKKCQLRPMLTNPRMKSVASKLRSQIALHEKEMVTHDPFIQLAIHVQNGLYVPQEKSKPSLLSGLVNKIGLVR